MKLYARQDARQDARATSILALHERGPLFRKLAAAGCLDDGVGGVLGGCSVRNIAQGVDIFAEGDSIGEFLFLAKGWAYRYRLLGNGRRHVVNVLVPGDIVGPFTPTAKQFVATLTETSIYSVARRNLGDESRTCVGFTAAVETLIAAEYEMLAERTVSLGRRNAKERMAHFLIEVFERLNRVGLAGDDTFELPLTQEMIGDALGLSVVHVNRTLKALREDGLVTLGFGRATIHDFDALSFIADSDGIPASSADRRLGVISMN